MARGVEESSIKEKELTVRDNTVMSAGVGDGWRWKSVWGRNVNGKYTIKINY